MRGDDDDWDRSESWASQNQPPRGKDNSSSAWAIILFCLIGAVSTTYAVGELRRLSDLFYAQFIRSQPSRKASNGASFRSYFQEGAWKKYRDRMQKEYEEEMERVERIRRMQNIFNREREKYKNFYGSSRGNYYDPYNQHFQHWYWKTGASHKNWSNSKETASGSDGNSLSRHYAVLGLDRSRGKTHTEAEIKAAFRAKAMEFHPDQNPVNKAAAEEMFKKVLMSYEAIKSERKKMGDS